MAIDVAHLVCYSFAMEPKRGRGRQVTTGVTPTRSIRMGVTWDEATALAKERGEGMRAFTERALELEIRRIRRVERSHDKEASDG